MNNYTTTTPATPVTAAATAMPAHRDLFGLFELDESGTVLYSRVRRDNALINERPAMVGRNFFDEVIPFENAAEFRRRFENFINGTHSSDNFIFNCRIKNSILPVKVLLMRIYDYGKDRQLKFVIVDIRKS